MKKIRIMIAVVSGLILIGVVTAILVRPWMDRWGATNEEIAATFPGDELVPAPASFVNRAVTIRAGAAQIYPWLVQLGAGKGGMYSYDWFETYVLQCQLNNADRIHPEWQDLKEGDPVRMCPGDFGPQPYTVARIEPEKAIVMGHRENGQWVDLWQFLLVPQSDGTTRLILRTRTMMVGGFWEAIHPGIFIMERGMLLGIKQRAEQASPVQ